MPEADMIGMAGFAGCCRKPLLCSTTLNGRESHRFPMRSGEYWFYKYSKASRLDLLGGIHFIILIKMGKGSRTKLSVILRSLKPSKLLNMKKEKR